MRSDYDPVSCDGLDVRVLEHHQPLQRDVHPITCSVFKLSMTRFVDVTGDALGPP